MVGQKGKELSTIQGDEGLQNVVARNRRAVIRGREIVKYADPKLRREIELIDILGCDVDSVFGSGHRKLLVARGFAGFGEQRLRFGQIVQLVHPVRNLDSGDHYGAG